MAPITRPKVSCDADAARQLEKRLQPLLPGAAEQFDVGPVLGAAQHGENRDGDDVQQRVIATSDDARVLDVRKQRLSPSTNFVPASSMIGALPAGGRVAAGSQQGARRPNSWKIRVRYALRPAGLLPMFLIHVVMRVSEALRGKERLDDEQTTEAAQS